VYVDNTESSFKIDLSKVKDKDKYVFVDDINYKAIQAPWELLKKAKSDTNSVTILDGQAYKQIFFQSKAHTLNPSAWSDGH